MRAMPTFDELKDLTNSGELITDGPLNRAYRIQINEEFYFVKERTLDTHQDYSQSFAGERHLPESLKDRIPIPSLLGVVSNATGVEKYSVFDYIPSINTKWNDQNIATLCKYLSIIHDYRRIWPGRPQEMDANVNINHYIKNIFLAEISKFIESHHVIDEFGKRAAKVISLLPKYGTEDICLCHGDVRDANFLTGRDGRLWLVDWEAIRYRVPASDFNQISHKWINDEEEARLLRSYCEMRNLALPNFLLEVQAYRVLWHLRTYNFKVNLCRKKGMSAEYHLWQAQEILNLVGL